MAADIGQYFCKNVNRIEQGANIDVLKKAVDRLGFPERSGVAFLYVPNPRVAGSYITAPLVSYTQNIPAAWKRRFVDQGGFRDDAIYYACLDNHVPFLWSEVAESSSLLSLRLSASQRSYMRFCQDVGIHRGYTVPIHLPGGALSVMTISGDAPSEEFHQAVRANGSAIFLLGHLFHDAVIRGFERRRATSNSHGLTFRELECLRWAAKGKTEGDIAAVLVRSSETVRDHLRNAARKLGASNRTHAVARAVLLGLVNPDAEA